MMMPLPTLFGVKHLNPRQGITTTVWSLRSIHPSKGSMCETPKSPPGDYNVARYSGSWSPGLIKCETPKSPPGDYNVEVDTRRFAGKRAVFLCETPKSPPGDYNAAVIVAVVAVSTSDRCETPKSPPGDYNPTDRSHSRAQPRSRCETPKSPPGDYNVCA